MGNDDQGEKYHPLDHKAGKVYNNVRLISKWAQRRRCDKMVSQKDLLRIFGWIDRRTPGGKEIHQDE